MEIMMNHGNGNNGNVNNGNVLEENVVDNIRDIDEPLDEDLVRGRRNHYQRYKAILKRMSVRERKRETSLYNKRKEQMELEKSEVEEKKRKLEEEEDASIKFTLMVQGRPLPCSKKTIKCSELFSEIVQWGEHDQQVVSDQGPIPVPEFISRQIMLDLVEIVEKGIKECAHLVLVSQSYLLDFLIAMDFLGCLGVQSAIEDIIQHQITESNWREVFNYTKNIPGTYNTACQAIEFVCKRLCDGIPRKEKPKEKATTCTKEKEKDKEKTTVYCNQTALMEGREEGWDPYEEDYTNLPAQYFKVFMTTNNLVNSFKFFLLKKWRNCNKENTGDIAGLICALLKNKSLGESTVSDIKKEISTWDLGEEGKARVEAVTEEAKKVGERDLEEKKATDRAIQLARRGGHFLHHGMMMEFPFDGMENLLIHF